MPPFRATFTLRAVNTRCQTSWPMMMPKKYSTKNETILPVPMFVSEKNPPGRRACIAARPPACHIAAGSRMNRIPTGLDDELDDVGRGQGPHTAEHERAHHQGAANQNRGRPGEPDDDGGQFRARRY